jgi:signal transduction histidine kinase
MLTRVVHPPSPGGATGARYAFALAATLLAMAAKLLLDRWTHNVSPYLFLTPVVVLSAWFGGLGPGMLATLASALAVDYFLLAPAQSVSRGDADLTRLVVFVAVGIQISYLSGALHKSNLGLERRVRQRTTELDFQKTLLESQIEASRDGILAVSQTGDVLFANRRFREVWGLSAAEASAGLAELRRAMRARLAEPVDVLSAGGDAERGPVIGDGSEQVVLADGRVLERYSAPVVAAEGMSYGRVWFFSDVTERRRLEKQILEAGERERQSIGQDLHDDLCQQLTGIACLPRVMQQRLTARTADEAGDAGTILDLVQRAIECCRGLSKGLQPVTLEADGLVAALRELCGRMEKVFGVPCRFQGDAGTVAFRDAAVATHLYRIAQEAITNAVKHARPKQIGVDLVAAGERLVLAVEDDGVGIPEVLPAEGLGLQTMRHRARMIGATLSIDREPGGGTTVTCSIRNPAGAERDGPYPLSPEYGGEGEAHHA